MESVPDKTVAVAVKKGKYSQLAVKWVVENLANEIQSLMLLHVRIKSEAFEVGGGKMRFKNSLLVNHCEEIASGLEQSYKETLNLQVKDMFSPLVSYCKKKNVRYKEVLVEDDDAAQGIAEYVFKNNIDVLVVGSGSRGGFLRRLRGPETANKIAKRMPYFCTVYTVGKGGAVFTKLASTTAQNMSSLNSVRIQEPEIGNHVRLVDSLTEPRVSVNAREPLIQSRSVNEFEFRSPLQNNGDSDFSWGGGHPPPDSDISFISSDKPYDHVSSCYSANSSNFSLGSFDMSRATSSAYSSIISSARTSDVSHSSQFNMDELRKLELELRQTKKMYEAACQETMVAKHLAFKPKPQNFEGYSEMNSAMEQEKLKNDKDVSAAKMTEIKKRIAELHALHNF